MSNGAFPKELLLNKKILVCCGPGGVGKTTTSAALALSAVRLGKKTAVITIDPAQRLVSSLGITLPKDADSNSTDYFDLNEPLKKVLTVSELKKGGELYAVIPKTQKTFEDLFKSLSSSDNALFNKIMKTSIFQIFAQEYSGAHEYMAMERLYQLSHKLETGELDFIVLDTPPSLTTKFFLDAPDHLLGFFDETLVKWLDNPGAKIFSLGVKKITQAIEHLTGQGFFSNLVEFSSSVYQLRTQFLQNLKKVSQTLQSSNVAFLGVSTPERLNEKDALDFVHFIQQKEYSFWGFILNRSLLQRYKNFSQKKHYTDEYWTSELSRFLDAEQLQLVENVHKNLLSTAQKEVNAVKNLSALNVGIFYVSEQFTDVYSLETLYDFSKNFLD